MDGQKHMYEFLEIPSQLKKEFKKFNIEFPYSDIDLVKAAIILGDGKEAFRDYAKKLVDAYYNSDNKFNMNKKYWNLYVKAYMVATHQDQDIWCSYIYKNKNRMTNPKYTKIMIDVDSFVNDFLDVFGAKIPTYGSLTLSPSVVLDSNVYINVKRPMFENDDGFDVIDDLHIPEIFFAMLKIDDILSRNGLSLLEAKILLLDFTLN